MPQNRSKSYILQNYEQARCSTYQNNSSVADASGGKLSEQRDGALREGGGAVAAGRAQSLGVAVLLQTVGSALFRVPAGSVRSDRERQKELKGQIKWCQVTVTARTRQGPVAWNL